MNVICNYMIQIFMIVIVHSGLFSGVRGGVLSSLLSADQINLGWKMDHQGNQNMVLIWFGMAWHGPVWPDMARYGLLLPSMALYGSVWSNMVLYVFVWFCMLPKLFTMGPLYTHRFSYGLVRSHLAPYGAVWPNMDQ